jgi:hypothetical protein
MINKIPFPGQLPYRDCSAKVHKVDQKVFYSKDLHLGGCGAGYSFLFFCYHHLVISIKQRSARTDKTISVVKKIFNSELQILGSATLVALSLLNCLLDWR